MHVQDGKKIKIHLNLLFLLVNPTLLRMQLASTSSSTMCDSGMGLEGLIVWPSPRRQEGKREVVLILSSEIVSLQTSLTAPKSPTPQSSAPQRSRQPRSASNCRDRTTLIWLRFSELLWSSANSIFYSSRYKH